MRLLIAPGALVLSIVFNASRVVIRDVHVWDGHAEELSDRWQEALTIRSWVEAMWQQLESNPAAKL